MSKITKVAISLPEELLQAVEAERQARGESRSQFFRRAAVSLLKQERESSMVEEYVRRYQEVPESAEEVETAHRAGSSILAEEPWE